MPVVFDHDESQRQKAEGMALAAANRAHLLWNARVIATALGKSRHVVHMDMVSSELLDMGISPEMLGNAAGSVFKNKWWVPVGFHPSARVTNHGRLLRRWRFCRHLYTGEYG